MRYLAIDFGSKNTGLALCDQSETIASPLTVLPTDKNLIERIADIVKKENVEAIVVGLPLNMDDSPGPQAQLASRFAERLRPAVNVPICFQDERLSTFAAEQKIAGLELPKKMRRRKIDSLAAAEILQSFLDSKHIK